MSPNLKYIFSALIPALGWGYWLWEEDRAVAKKCGKIGTIAFAVGFLFSMCTGLIGGSARWSLPVYKPRTQDTATEVRTGHVGVADPHL